MPKTTNSDILKRVGKAKVELFKRSVTLAPTQRDTFRKNPSKFLRKLFQREGHEVNDLQVTNVFETRTSGILDRTPKNSNVQLDMIVVHVVQGDIIFPTSTYL